jgi:ribonuclease HII
MPWLIGIDEAGYGPNLGPFVMSSVALRVPADLAEANLWRPLRAAVRRHREADDGRLLLEDSKLVYSTARGLKVLETGVLAVLGCIDGRCLDEFTLARLLINLCASAGKDLSGECWYAGTTPLPIAADTADLGEASERLARACAEAGVYWGPVYSVVVCPPRFNAVLDRWGSKGLVLSLGLAELLRANLGPDRDAEAVAFLIDKHGGRNTYAALLQQAVPDGMVLAVEERPERSVYRVAGLPAEVRLTFAPRADASHLCVALASMVSKYLRELFMSEFNGFWQRHVPGLKPTAGYPGDAARFWSAIRPAAERLGIAEAALWRRK